MRTRVKRSGQVEWCVVIKIRQRGVRHFLSILRHPLPSCYRILFIRVKHGIDVRIIAKNEVSMLHPIVKVVTV